MAAVDRKQTETALSSAAVAVEERRRLSISGIVQGVGFRPFVYRLAVSSGLKGFIRNTPSGVLIEVQGASAHLDLFSHAVRQDAPPLARIETVEEKRIDSLPEEDFVIGYSSAGSEVETLIPPDIAICEECRKELFDPANPRFRYPFINCTNCGPRYTIVSRLPYDRQFTSMHAFAMCGECEREYMDPLDRRFHAEPTACPVCGPAIQLLDASGRTSDADNVLVEASAILRSGGIIALKGVGGFHLAVDASNEEAVQRLRARKGREAKPFAVMMPDASLAVRYCELSDGELAALNAAEAPIVLLKKRDGTALAPSVAPDSDRLGVMLAYSPLHALLFDGSPEVLVMTSANFSEEPITSENDDAVKRLQGIADAFLVHNRPIYLKCDDSVTIYLSGKLRQLRRSRGYVPAPVYLRESGPSVLGTGGELKNTITLLKGSHAILSQHIGDMKNFESYRHYEHVALHLQHLFQASPELVVHDLHPDYMTTLWAARQELPRLGVQHHHAHLASCLAEQREDGPVIGLILDGTGYGSDGTIWGGELLIGDAGGAERFASLEPMPLPGGEAAIMQPWRAAIGYLFRSFPEMPELPFMNERCVDPVVELLQKHVGIYETSSCGRLFDAIAALCGLKGEISYEGEAAVALTHAAGGSVGDSAFSYGLQEDNGRWIMLVSPIIRDAAAAVLSGVSAAEISRCFHRTLLDCFQEIIAKASMVTGIKTVALSGGVFQNALLFETLIRELETGGYRVLAHSLVPSNDGGLSLGQAMIGREYLKGNYRGVY
ncbi:carbamoyltransferase HypF [Chlorobium sp. BLA1]|uniref:carbamoyltransferase HypF n=1 Tax=Candidatus Chlorobium masyuteum TaxID=2716876 RepID=UPI0014234096|nr:carbamoyltransferase HypF [Candidatus Chlorobium masyuteum]NHQ60186.1 carbamoyltransferase HypF [Candidatus Chlorobium masyuteum]